MKNTTYYCRLKVLSPVHIGCDEVYEPTGFALDEQKKELISFEPSSFLGMLEQQDRDQFSAICRKGTVQSLLEIYKFIRQHKEHAHGRRVAVSDDFVDHYKQTLNLPPNAVQQQLNKFQVGRTACQRIGSVPYIPGSALKGALRTAVLNLRNGGSRQPTFRDGQQLNDNLSGGTFATDPFRLIKVGDFQSADQVSQRIVYGVNRKKRPSKKEARRPYQILEVIEAGAEFVGTITVQQTPAAAGIKKPVLFEEIRQALATFYPRELEREKKLLQSLGCDTAFLEERPAGTMLVRMGRHSGAECVTVEGHRNIKIMQGPGVNPKYKSHATTIWLAAGSANPSTNRFLQPFGWVEFSLLSEEDARMYTKKRIEKYKSWENEQQQAISLQKRKGETLARQQEEERKEQDRLAEEQRQEEEELRQHPWRAVLPRLEAIRDWGALKTQGLEHADFVRYQDEPEVGRAIAETTRRVARLTEKKWDRERDQLIADWLQASGVHWQPMAKDKQATSPVQKDNSALLAQINSLAGWQEFRQSGLKIPRLDKQCALALKAKFSEWKLKKSKEKQHQKAFKDVIKRLNQLG